jgi:hypothetical protein
MNLEQVGNALLSLDGEASRTVLDAVDEIALLKAENKRLDTENERLRACVTELADMVLHETPGNLEWIDVIPEAFLDLVDPDSRRENANVRF